MLGLLLALASARRHKRHTIVENSQYGYVTPSIGLNMRSGPGTGYSIIGAIPCGGRVEILSESNGWYRINYNGNTGYVCGDYVRKDSGSSGGGGSGTRMSGFYITGYYPEDSLMEGGFYDCLGNTLATLQQFYAGQKAYCSIAVDRSVIPMRSIVNIDGYDGVKFWACDVGGAIKGRHIDICVANRQESYRVTTNGKSITVYGTSSKPQ